MALRLSVSTDELSELLNRSEARLQEAERRHQEVLDSLGDTVFEMNLEGRITSVNRSAFDRWGYTPEDFERGLNAFDLVAPEDRDLARRNAARVFAGEKPFSEYRGLRKDGTRFWMSVTSTRIMKDGRVAGLRGLVVDVTKRRLADEALRQSERRYRELYNETPVMLHSIDREGRLISVSDYWLAALGYTRDEVIGCGSIEFLTEESRRHAIEDVLPGFMRTGSCTNVEYQFVKKNGEIIDTLLSATAELDEAGQLVRSLAVVIDVTDRKRAEESIRRSEERYRSLVQNAVFGIYRTDADGRFVEANPALAAMLGYEDEGGLIGRDISGFYQDPAQRDRLVGQYAATDRIEGVEVQWKRRDGSPIMVRLTGRPVRADDGTTGFEMIVEDVSERTALEQQFRQAQKMEAIGRLAGGIAHDFNNLLTAMGGYSDLLIGQFAEDDPRRQDLLEIRKAANRAGALTRQLLAFSRKQILQPKAVRLSAVLDGVDPLLRRLIGEDVEVVTIPAADAGLVRADPIQLEQVIMNLAVNARDAMPGGGRLTIETRNVTFGADRARVHQGVAPGRYVMLAVTDTGCGMDPEVKSHLFEPFFTTKERGKGTGLGLATVYGIVRQSGGHIYVDSEPKQGSTFEVYFPRLDEEADRARAHSVPAASPSGTETILLAEDEDAVRRLTRDVLMRQGYRVLEARTGGEALSVSTGFPERIDLLLTDVVMPEMGGRELAQRLLMQRPFLKVIYVSGHSDEMVVRGRILEPGVAFLPKPFTPEGLTAAVREMLDEVRIH
jgi:two-component system, cell cycle sensor histidine kinase and response regulator CckA